MKLLTHWGNQFPWQLNHCFLPKGQAISRHSTAEPSFPSKARISVVQQGNSTGKNSPWESTVCSWPNSLMRRPLQGQRQPLHTVPDTWFQIVRSQALSQIFPDQYFLGLNQDVSLCMPVSRHVQAGHSVYWHGIQPKAPGRPDCISLGRLLQMTHEPSLQGNLLPAVQGTTSTPKWPLLEKPGRVGLHVDMTSTLR